MTDDTDDTDDPVLLRAVHELLDAAADSAFPPEMFAATISAMLELFAIAAETAAETAAERGDN